MFLVVRQSKPHEGAVRPFLNLVHGLSGKIETSIALYGCGGSLVEYVKGLEIPLISTQSRDELLEAIRCNPPDFVVCDDNMASLRTLNSLDINHIAKLVVYAQVLYGAHSIADCFDLGSVDTRDRIVFSLSKWIPFSVLRRIYVNALGNDKIIIANSKATANLLQTFYGIDVQGIVYPPIDTEVFRPSDDTKNSLALTLYLGSRAGDTRIDFIRKIIKEIRKNDHLVNLFGSEMLSTILKHDFTELQYLEYLDDKKLSDIYSQSILTVCPQKWETFGLVPVESMACGTPVLAFNCMGHQETIINGKTGLLAESYVDFLSLLERSLTDNMGKFRETVLRNHVVDNFSIPVCADHLVTSLRKSV